jgi:NlpC/P60 family putative phage cell wall peptidase
VTERSAVVAEARGWLGTPFAHQAHAKGVGADCAGLVAGVAISLGLLPADWWERSFAPWGGYPRTPTIGIVPVLCRRFMRHLEPAQAQAGDVLLLRLSVEPQHLAIATPYQHGGLAMIHAYSRAGAVVEHRLADVWRARIVAAFALPGIDA